VTSFSVAAIGSLRLWSHFYASSPSAPGTLRVALQFAASMGSVLHCASVAALLEPFPFA
jgi:hypothetical protein